MNTGGKCRSVVGGAGAGACAGAEAAAVAGGVGGAGSGIQGSGIASKQRTIRYRINHKSKEPIPLGMHSVQLGMDAIRGKPHIDD